MTCMSQNEVRYYNKRSPSTKERIISYSPMPGITKNDVQDSLSQRPTNQGQNGIHLLTLPDSKTFNVASIAELESERPREFATHQSIARFTKTFKNGGEETRGARCTRDKGRGVSLPSHSLHPLEATCDPTWHNAIEVT